MSNAETPRQESTLIIEQVLQQAIVFHQAGQLQDAERLYQAVLQIQPNHSDAQHNLELLVEQIKQATISIPHFKVLLENSPGQAQNWFNYIDALILTGQIENAQQILLLGQQHGLHGGMMNSLAERLKYPAARITPATKQSTILAASQVEEENSNYKKIKVGNKKEKTETETEFTINKKEQPPPQQIDELVRLFNEGHLAEVIALSREITENFPDYNFGWKALGAALKQTGQNVDALLPLQRAVELATDDAETHNNLAITLTELGRFEEAEASSRRALQLQPSLAEAHNTLGTILHALSRLDEAEACYRLALQLKPSYVVAYNNLSITLQDLGRLEEAEYSCNTALKINPEYVLAYLTLANIHYEHRQFAEAEACCRRALQIRPNYAEAHDKLGYTLQALNRLNEAKANYLRALEIKPDYEAAYSNLISLFLELDLLDEAEACCRRALKIKPDFLPAQLALGNLFLSLGQLDEAEANYRQALLLKPDSKLAFSNLLFSLNYHPDKKSEEIFAAYQEYDTKFCLPLRREWKAHLNSRETQRRLKIGYVSPDFKNHSLQFFLEPLLAHHNKQVVEVYAYAELVNEDVVTSRYQNYVDHWIPTRGLSDAVLAERIRADGIDILIDLAGHTAKNRLPVFARKPAPVSISWMGYGYTTGLTAIDYFLTDMATAPPGSEALFSETPYRVATPNCSYRPAEGMGEVNTLPALTNGYITFGTLTRPERINHRTIQVWSEILKRLKDARLVFDSKAYCKKFMQDRLAEKFAAHGIARDRLEIGYHSPPWDVLRSIDIGLDCFPHNSGTTLLETLYMGIPFVTLAGRPSVGRIGSCLLQGIGRSEWIAENEADYVTKMVELASDVSRLSEIRATLREQMENSLFRDEAGFALKIEAAYREMWKIWCEKGEKNDNSH